MTKQEVEAKIFKSFFDSFGLELGLSGNWKQDERPDFRVSHEGKVIGIELTRYSIGAGEEGQNAICEAIVKEAQLEYLKTNFNKIQLFFDFNRDFPISNKTKFVKRLKNLAISLSDEPTGQVSSSKFLHVKELRYISLHAEPDNIWSNWEIYQTYSTPDFCKTKFEEIVNKKELKSKEYSSCDENWLLVSMNLMDRAQDSNIDFEKLFTHSSNVFSKIILYRMAYQDIFVFEKNKVSTCQLKT